MSDAAASEQHCPRSGKVGDKINILQEKNITSVLNMFQIVYRMKEV
jgi:hypothetical protein